MPENQFLKKFGFVDDKLRLVDKQGKLVDEEGKHIDDWGNFVEWIDDDNYIFVDDQGREVKDGKFNTEFVPFIDDETGELFDEDGNPIKEEKPKPKRKKRAAKNLHNLYFGKAIIADKLHLLWSLYFFRKIEHGL